MLRPLALTLVAVLGAVVFSGCVSESPRPDPGTPPAPQWTEDDPRLSQPIYADDGIVKEHALVPSFDGVKIDNWVFRPKTPAGVKIPVFINFSPYWSNLAPTAESGGDAFSKYLIEYFLPRGYAIVLSSARGTGYSEGCFNLGGMVEMQDSYQMIEYFADQEWSNGNVGAGGKSYDGTMPNGAAVLNPPHLRTIIPVSGISELYKYNYMGGVSYTHGHRFNQYYYMGVGMDVGYGNPKVDQPALIVDDAKCPYLPEMQAYGVASGAIGDSNNYWQERNYTKRAGEAKAAMWLIHGLQDWNVKPDHILPWYEAYGGPKKAWLHQWQEGGTGHVYPMRPDWNLTMLRWLDHWLKDVPTGIMDDPAVQVQDSSKFWRHEASWPPGNINSTAYDLSAASIQRQRVSVLTQSIESEGRIVGAPKVVVSVTPDRPDARLIATLSMSADGKTTSLTYGALNLRHRQSLDDPQPVVPGTEYRVTFRMHPIDALVPAGAELTLSLGTEGSPFFTTPQSGTLSVAGGGKSQLHLDWRQGTLDPEDPQPTQITCFAC
jgi:X-Pro dipeptidyl-peptidase